LGGKGAYVMMGDRVWEEKLMGKVQDLKNTFTEKF